MPLSDIAIRSAKPREKAYKLADGGGMYLEVSPAGGKWWRLKYRYDGKEKRLSVHYASLAPTSSQTLSTTAATSCRKELRSGEGVTSGIGAARSRMRSPMIEARV